MRGEALKMAELEGKRERIEEAYQPTLVMRITWLKYYLLALGRLTGDLTPPRRELRAKRQDVAYLMGDTSGLGFGLALWGQGKLVL